MPSLLKTGTLYRYRLRLIHEGGRGVGGPWASHVASVPPPRCIDAGRRGLVLCLPRVHNARPRSADTSLARTAATTTGFPARDDTQTPESEHQAFAQGEVVVDVEGDKATAAAGGEGREALDYDQKAQWTEAGRNSNVLRVKMLKKQTEEREVEQDEGMPCPGAVVESETPMVRYTLQGLEAKGCWRLLYHGTQTDVIVEVRT